MCRVCILEVMQRWVGILEIRGIVRFEPVVGVLVAVHLVYSVEISQSFPQCIELLEPLVLELRWICERHGNNTACVICRTF